ncbi:vitellogenin-1-like [Ixodes scapularis]|uniref:vitellogenin-1-like n=1 Tax=Ixodes scapularis TaxID=6945 RepID=UPI001C3878CB|nr:vitellogenin-1-like [Ixodes scapularis]
MRVLFVLPAFLFLATCSAFETGKEYVYNYNGRLQIKNPEQPLQSSGFAFRSKVVAQPKSDHTYFKITDFEVDSFNGDRIILDDHQFNYHSTDDLRKFIERPFAGTFSHGKIVEIAIGREEPLWSKNLKKGVLSTFQLDLVTGRQNNPTVEEYTTREHGLHGNCETKYLVTEKEGHIEVFKVRDLDLCDKEAHIVYGRIKGHKCVECEAMETHPLSSTFEVKYRLDGTSQHYVIKHASAASDTLFQPFGAGKAVRVVVNRTLFLDEERAANADMQLPDDVGVSDELTHSFSEYGKAQTLEDLKHPNHFIIDSKLQNGRQNFVEGLNHLAAFGYDDSDIGSVDTKESGALRFLLLFRSMASMRYEDIEQVYEQNVVNAPEPNRQNVRRLFLDVLAAAGSNPHVAFGLKLLKEGKLSGGDAEHFLTRLPLNLKEHSPALITQLADICRSQIVRSQRQMWVMCILSLSTIAGQHGCVRGKTEDEPDKGTCSVALISQFFNYSVTPADVENRPEHTHTVFIKAAGNLATRSALHYLKRFIGFEGHPPIYRRTNALWALKAAAHHHPALARNIALPVYENKSEMAVIRIAAFRCILETKPNLYKLRHIARYVIDDPSDQVASYVTSTFRALLKSKYPCHQELAQHLRYVVPMWDNVQRFSKPLDYTQSQLALLSGYDPEYDYGGATIFSMIQADDSYLPRSLYLKAKDYYAGYSYDTIAMSFEGWGLNKLIDGVAGPRPGSTKNLWNFGGRRRFTREASAKDRKEIEDALPIQDWPFDPFYARIGLSMYGNEIDTWEIDERMLAELKESEGEYKPGDDPWDILTKKVRRKSFFLNNDYVLLVPTDMGVPVFMDFKSVDFAFVDRQKFDFIRTADDKFSLDVKRRYVFENRGFSVVGVALTFNETAVGSGSDSRTVLSLPLEFKATLDTVNHKLHLQRPLALPWNILNHHNRPSTFALPFDPTRDIGNAVIQLADPPTPLYNKFELTEIDRGFRTDSLPIGLNVEGSMLSKGLSEGLHKFWYEMDWRQKFYYAAMNPHWHPRELRLTLVEAEKNFPTTIELDLSHKFLKPEDARESKFPVHDAIDGDTESPSTHVLNAELNFRGGKKDRKIATELRYSYTSDTFKHKMQFFYDRATSQQKKEHIKICLDSTLKFPAPEWSRLKNLATFHEGKEIDCSLNIRYGTNCEGQSSITFNGKFTHTDDDAQQIRENAEAKPRSPNRLRPFYLRDMYSKCVHHQKLGIPLNYYCVKYMYYSSRLGKLTMDVEYKKLKPLLPGLYSHLTEYHSHSEDHVGFFEVIGEHMDGPTGKLRVVSQVPPRHKCADVLVSTSDGHHFFHPHVPLYSHILEPRVFVAFGYTNIAEYTAYYKQKYCDLQGSSVRTFDGIIVQLPETNCFKVISRDCTPDNKRFLILARSTGNPALPKALKMFIHNTKIEILQIAADAGLVVRVDGSRVEVPLAVPYSHMSHGAELFKIKLKSKFYLIESSSYGLSVGFDGKVLTVQTASFYRGSLCGLCADYNYDRLNELLGSDHQVHNDTLEFAESYVVPSSDCTPP